MERNCFTRITHEVDVCVVGGGMAGLIAAVAAARRGAKTLLVHDRPVLGGNASSEVRMWICGALGRLKKETGLLEEIQLANRARNPSGIYSIWDSVLFQFAHFTPGLTTLLNSTCTDADMDGSRIAQISAWEMPTQTWHRIHARFFLDCSGDSILAPLSGAKFRHGRESREEFLEPLAPMRADLKTMGNSILLQLEETATPQPFTPPGWAYRFDQESVLPSRVGEGFGTNFWWIELGGLKNTITDAAATQRELYRAAWGVLDYLKNRGPQAEKLANWRLRWMGSVAGKRENRRYVGPHILTQHDLAAGGPFDDIVAYGGWSMDDHHPAGLYYPGKPTIFHPAPSPYGIPLRSLYSVNIENLFFAGRNISATHAALSSTRVMATCSLLGQAVGTAAALCVKVGCLPSAIQGPLLRRLQQQLMEDDCWLPGRTRELNPETRAARLSGPGEVEALRNGHDRPVGEDAVVWNAEPNSTIILEWDAPQLLTFLRLVADSDLNDSKKLPCTYRLNDKQLGLPARLLRSWCLEARTPSGSWETVHREEHNIRRLVYAPVGRTTSALRLRLDASHGSDHVSLHSVSAFGTEHPPVPREWPAAVSWNDLVAALPPEDLAPPDHGLEELAGGSGRFGA